MQFFSKYEIGEKLEGILQCDFWRVPREILCRLNLVCIKFQGASRQGLVSLYLCHYIRGQSFKHSKWPRHSPITSCQPRSTALLRSRKNPKKDAAKRQTCTFSADCFTAVTPQILAMVKILSFGLLHLSSHSGQNEVFWDIFRTRFQVIFWIF